MLEDSKEAEEVRKESQPFPSSTLFMFTNCHGKHNLCAEKRQTVIETNVDIWKLIETSANALCWSNSAVHFNNIILSTVLAAADTPDQFREIITNPMFRYRYDDKAVLTVPPYKSFGSITARSNYFAKVFSPKDTVVLNKSYTVEQQTNCTEVFEYYKQHALRRQKCTQRGIWLCTKESLHKIRPITKINLNFLIEFYQFYKSNSERPGYDQIDIFSLTKDKVRYANKITYSNIMEFLKSPYSIFGDISTIALYDSSCETYMFDSSHYSVDNICLHIDSRINRLYTTQNQLLDLLSESPINVVSIIEIIQSIPDIKAEVITDFETRIQSESSEQIKKSLKKLIADCFIDLREKLEIEEDVITTFTRALNDLQEDSVSTTDYVVSNVKLEEFRHERGMLLRGGKSKKTERTKKKTERKKKKRRSRKRFDRITNMKRQNYDFGNKRLSTMNKLSF
jgi:hypothetical protein